VTALRRRYLPEEAYALGLLDPSTPLEMFQKLTSRSVFSAVQAELNPREWEWTLADKALFYRICMAEGLLIPKLYAVFLRDAAGWTPEGRMPDSETEWERFFLEHASTVFVIKPARSVYGEGVRIVAREGRKFTDHDGRQVTAGELVASLRGKGAHPEMVIQEKLNNHPDIAPLSGGGGVLSLRLISYVPPDGVPQVLTANIKIIVGRNIVSNNRHGLLGNLTAEVDLSTGRIVDAREERLDGRGFVIVPAHPDTGAVFRSWRIPYWHESLDLATKAARIFLPVRTVGWDVAITPDGPRLLEGNIWYDPPAHFGATASILAGMSSSEHS
jgi:hypothetical protein